MNIVTPPHPALRTRAEEAIPSRCDELVLGMSRVLRRNPGAVGLAANQVGILKRVIVWALPGQRVRYAINPVFVPDADSARRKGTEGCLSLPGQQVRVERFTHGTLFFDTLSGEKARYAGHSLLARIWQHEIDHLNGVLLTDHLPTPETSTK
jgi:peptide deformylase